MTKPLEEMTPWELEVHATDFLKQGDRGKFASSRLSHPYHTVDQERTRRDKEIPVSNLPKNQRNDITNRMQSGFDFED